MTSAPRGCFGLDKKESAIIADSFILSFQNGIAISF